MQLLTILMILGVSLNLSCGLTFVNRRQWGGRAPTSRRTLRTPVPFVFIHHTDTPNPNSQYNNAHWVRSVQNFHMKKGWNDIGYNFLVGTDGKVYIGQGWQTVGTHTGRYNSQSIAISFIGKYDSATPNYAQQKAARDLIQFGVKRGYISGTYGLYGHRDAMKRACPGNRLYAIIRRWPRYGARPL